MGYLTDDQLAAMGFKKIGKNVKISDKASIYNADQIEIGNHSRIDDFCVVSGKVTLGDYIHIAAFCLLGGGTAGITIGDFSGVAYGSKIFSQTDDYSGECMLPNPLVPPRYTNVSRAPVIIERHSVVGTQCVVFPGVHIAEGCSIGSMSLVTKSTDPWGIYIGIPAKRVKDKSKNSLNLEKQFLEEIA